MLLGNFEKIVVVAKHFQMLSSTLVNVVNSKHFYTIYGENFMA